MTLGFVPDLRRLRDVSRTALEQYQAPEVHDHVITRPFVPESFTQLYHTPLYHELDDAQRLRYNQLYGLRSNELFMLFEEGFTRRVIAKLQHHCSHDDPLLGECLQLMLEEEANHHRMFLAFNRRLLPKAYHDAGGYFARPSAAESLLLKLLTSRPVNWPFMLWLILLLEEFSTAFSRMLMSHERSDGLSPEYVQLHRRHLADEARHIVLDRTLIERYLPQLPKARQQLNGRLFRRLFREMATPKRSGIRVLQTLAEEYPRLSPLLPQMVRAVRNLPHDPGLYPIVTDAARLPLTHALLSKFPNFNFAS